MANRVKVVSRIREAARELHAAVEKARLTVAEYTADGGQDWTDPFFYVGEDVGNPPGTGELRTDLDISKEDLVAGEVALNAISNGAMAPGATINDYLPALSKIK